jgi:hypothetical protein
MWCSVCQNDVATEVGADNRRVSCSNCGHLLSGGAGAAPEQAAATTAPSSGPDTRAEEARQLLDRWAKGHFFDPYGPPKKTGVSADSSIAVPTENEQRTDTDHDVAMAAAPPSPEKPHVAPSEPQQLLDTNRSEPSEEALDGPSPTLIHEPERPVPAPTTVPDAAASAAELDRLTREIMDRVSRITEARETASDQQTGDRVSIEHSGNELTSVAAGGADSDFAGHPAGSVEETRQMGGSFGHDNSRHAEVAAFDGSVQPHSGTSIRMDAPHQPSSAPAMSQFAASPMAAPAGTAPVGVSTANASPTSAVSNGWYNNIGQMLAYLGIISLTAGTCAVIVSYFGGPENYAPYGWLGATIGQMLLFLGIVTLISAGMEQTSQELRQAVDQRMDEVTQRLDAIGSRIMRVEEGSSDGPPRPHLITPTEQENRRTARQTDRHVSSDG